MPQQINKSLKFIKRKKHDIAILKYTKIIEKEPNNYQAYKERGNAYYRKKLYHLAIADYTKAIELNPEYFLPDFDS